MERIHMTNYCLAAIVCWVLVGGTACFAIYSKRINDTLLERVSLSCISISSAAVAWYLWNYGWISPAGFYLSLSFGLYAAAVTWKHWRRYTRGEPPEPRCFRGIP